LTHTSIASGKTGLRFTINATLAFQLILQLLLGVWMIASMDYCCDSGYYLTAGKQLLDQGLFTPYQYEGHRSYLAPVSIRLIHDLPFASWISALSRINDYQRFAVNLLPIWMLMSFAASKYAMTRVEPRRAQWIAALVYANPILLGHILVPMQESIMLLVFAPVFALLSLGLLSSMRLASAVLLTVIAYMIRESYAFVAAPLLIFAIYNRLFQRGEYRSQSIRATILAVLAGALLIAPQSIRNHQLHGHFAVYHSAQIQNDQLLWGTRMYKYATEKIDGNWKGVAYQIPETEVVANGLSLITALKQQEAYATKAIANHMLVGLVHDQVGPYGPKAGTSVRGMLILFSSGVVFFGLAGMALMLMDKTQVRSAFALSALLLLSLAYTAFVATETRFGILGFFALCLSANAYFSAVIRPVIKWGFAALLMPVVYLVLTWDTWLSQTRYIMP
jgi:mRNA-degrading endonuclease YafQ of YafQ-DinJ toxin-antitoxin module